MRILLLALIISVSGCVSQSRKLDVSVCNTTEVSITLNIQAGFLSKKLELKPGQTWNGWLWRDIPIKNVKIDVVSKTETEDK